MTTTIDFIMNNATNNDIKIFECIKNKFYHSDAKHGLCFHCVSILTQITLMEGLQLFYIDYNNLIDDIDAGLHI